MGGDWLRLDQYAARVYRRGNELVITGYPPDEPDDWPEDDPRRHNCDAMGCGSTEHIILRATVKESP